MTTDNTETPLNQAARRALAAQHLKRAILLLLPQDIPDEDVADVTTTATLMMEDTIAEESGRRSRVVQPAETRACRDCRVEFMLTGSEQQYYADKGLALPRRCVDCRRLRRQERGETR